MVVMQGPLPVDMTKPAAAKLPSCATRALMRLVISLGLAAACAGCGTMRDNTATQQLLLSDAVDRAVSHIDFSPLNGERVYLDTQYLAEEKQSSSSQKSGSLVNSDYIISSLRQQMMAAGCMMQE